jgi:plastocyanin
MPRPRRSRWAAFAVAIALAPAGCGGDEAPVTADGGRLTVELDDFLLRPQAVHARPGPIVLEAVNRGRIGHNLHVRRGERDVIEIATLLPGERGTATGTLRPGEYTLVCTNSNHRVLGMYGTLTVR